jgi:DNA-binding response OmpR family regulator
VLLVEDDTRLAAVLRRGLEQAGFSLDTMTTGEEAVVAGEVTPFDVIVLDLMLAGAMDGIAVCAELRDQRVRTPVLMLTARDAVDDRVRGLEAGADDYLVKPFALRELVARIRALARRHLDDRSAVLEIAGVHLDTSSREVLVRGRVIELTAKEFAVLEYLMHHPRRVLSRTQIEEHVWNYEMASESNLVEVYVGRIRRKLAAAGVEELISTVRGAGYRLQRQAECDTSHDEPASA